MAKKSKQEKADGSVYEELRTSAHKIWLAGLGAMSAAEQEGSKFFRQLVERGEEFETKGRERFEEARTRASERLENVSGKISGTLEEQVSKALKRMGVPSRPEIEALSEKIDHLAGRVEALAKKSPPKTSAARKKGGSKKASSAKTAAS